MNRLVNAQGDVNAGTHVQHVHFDGIDLASNRLTGSVIHYTDTKHGFSTKIGQYRFEKGKNHTVTLSTQDSDGIVIADAVAFVKVAD